MHRRGDTNKNRSLPQNTPNWTLFSDIVDDKISKIQLNNQSNIENAVETLTNILISAVEISIGSHFNYNNKSKVSKWNEEIAQYL